MIPSKKSPELENVIKTTFQINRTRSIRENTCIPSPIGCGKTIDPKTEFKDEISKREYTISGLCSECQEKLFNK